MKIFKFKFSIVYILFKVKKIVLNFINIFYITLLLILFSNKNIHQLKYYMK